MLNIDLICDELREAFEVEANDPVSIMTLIEFFVDRINRKSVPASQKSLFLLNLIELLDSHREILALVGWDLPIQFMKFLTIDNINIRKNLRDGPIASAIILGFNIVTLGSLPKETFDTGCKLMSSLSFTDEEANNVVDHSKDPSTEVEKEERLDDEYEIETDDEEKVTKELPKANGVYYERTSGDFFVGFKMYLLFEMVAATLKRISTLYPSKYLSLAVSSIEEMILSNVDELADSNLMLRRIHSFCRGYESCAVPKDVLEKLDTDQEGALTKKQLRTIQTTENEIQAKLLRRLCTFSIATCNKQLVVQSEYVYFFKLSQTEYKLHDFYNELFELQSRYYNLALSLDIDLIKEFKECVDESKRIYHALPAQKDITSKEAEGRITEVVFKLSYSWRLQKMIHEKKLHLSHDGIVALSSIYYLETRQHLIPTIALDDAIYLYLNYVTRSFYANIYDNIHVETSVRYWLWVGLTTNTSSKLREQISGIQPYILKVFLKTLLLKNCKQTNQTVRMVVFTLITRLLCVMPEYVIFEFVIETLDSFPYPHGKSAALILLNDLVLKTKKIEKNDDLKTSEKEKDGEDSLTEKLANMNIHETCYMTLNQKQMDKLFELAMDALKLGTLPNSKETDINLVSNYYVFIKSMKKNHKLIDMQQLDVFEKRLEMSASKLKIGNKE